MLFPEKLQNLFFAGVSELGFLFGFLGRIYPGQVSAHTGARRLAILVFCPNQTFDLGLLFYATHHFVDEVLVDFFVFLQLQFLDSKLVGQGHTGVCWRHTGCDLGGTTGLPGHGTVNGLVAAVSVLARSLEGLLKQFLTRKCIELAI